MKQVRLDQCVQYNFETRGKRSKQGRHKLERTNVPPPHVLKKV